LARVSWSEFAAGTLQAQPPEAFRICSVAGVAVGIGVKRQIGMKVGIAPSTRADHGPQTSGAVA